MIRFGHLSCFEGYPTPRDNIGTSSKVPYTYPPRWEQARHFATTDLLQPPSQEQVVSGPEGWRERFSKTPVCVYVCYNTHTHKHTQAQTRHFQSHLRQTTKNSRSLFSLHAHQSPNTLFDFPVPRATREGDSRECVCSSSSSTVLFSSILFFFVHHHQIYTREHGLLLLLVDPFQFLQSNPYAGIAHLLTHTSWSKENWTH